MKRHLQSIHLLVVDDNPADTHLIERHLKIGLSSSTHLSLHFSHCTNSAQCLKIIKAKTFHCILLDYLLGAENGIELLKQIIPLAPTTSIIMLTGEGDETVAVESMKLGASDYLVKKHLNPQSLTRAVCQGIERSQLRWRLKEKHRELEEFAYTAAHDLKTPLVALHQSLQLLQLKLKEPRDKDQDQDQDQTHSNKEVHQICQSLKQTSLTMTHFIRDLLDYASSDQLTFSWLHLNHLVSNVLNQLAPLLEQNNAQVRVGALAEIKANPVAMVQVIQNLVSNSIKYRDPQRDLVIEIALKELNQQEKRSYQYKLCFSDNGVGIGPEQHQKVFSPLVRGENQGQEEGHGLGLAVAKKRINQHGGAIWIESNSLGGIDVICLLKKDPGSCGSHFQMFKDIVENNFHI